MVQREKVFFFASCSSLQQAVCSVLPEDVLTPVQEYRLVLEVCRPVLWSNMLLVVFIYGSCSVLLIEFQIRVVNG